MIELTLTVSALEASVVLHKQLGELRAWPDFLADNIRGRQSVGGFTLMPCAKKKGARGYQTRYAVADLKAFIAAVKAANPKAKPAPMKAVTLAIDTGKPWWLNKFDPKGGRVCKQRIFAGAHTH